MNDGCLVVFLLVLCLLSTAIFEKQNSALKAKYNVVCGSLNDCCRNMIDTYNFPDSIYNSYLDIIEEQGYNKLEVKHLYYSY